MQLLETAAGKASGDVGKQFDAAIANNLTTVRMFGFGTMGGFPLQSGIGSYNEQAFQAFDKVSISQATNTHPHAYSRSMAALVTLVKKGGYILTLLPTVTSVYFMYSSLQVLDEAAKRQLRLVVALANNWDQDSNADNK